MRDAENSLQQSNKEFVKFIDKCNKDMKDKLRRMVEL